MKNETLIKYLCPASKPTTKILAKVAEWVEEPSKPTTKILAKVAEWVEEHKFLTNWETIEHDGWRHPSIKEKYDWCGIWRTIGCLNKNIHEMLGYGSRFFIKHYPRSCYRPSCKECYLKWIARAANRATRRMEKYSNRKPIHLMLMAPPSQNDIPYKLLRKRMLEIARLAGWEGGAVVFHPFKFNKRLREFYYSPHFHLVGFGSEDKISKAFGRFGWYIKIKDERNSVFQTFCYLLSHCGIKKGHHAVTWIGSLSYSKVPSEKEPKTSNCPICWCPLVQVWYEETHPITSTDQYFEGLIDFDPMWHTVDSIYDRKIPNEHEYLLYEDIYHVYDIIHQAPIAEPVSEIVKCYLCETSLDLVCKMGYAQKCLFSIPEKTLVLWDCSEKKVCDSCYMIAIDCMSVYSKRQKLRHSCC